MTTLTVSRARVELYRLLDKAAELHDPIQIVGKRHNGVLISAEDWSAIEETLYLVSISGMKKSIRNGLKTPIKKCSKKLVW